MSTASRTPLVTDASGGIGIALQLAKDGYQVAITDLPHQRDETLETVKQIEMFGVTGHLIEADSSSREQVFKALNKTYKTLGSFNTIVNKARIASVEPLVDVNEEMINHMNKININGVLWGIQGAAKQFESLNQKGKAINACSIVGHDPFSKLGIYSASKWAVRGLTYSLEDHCQRLLSRNCLNSNVGFD